MEDEREKREMEDELGLFGTTVGSLWEKKRKMIYIPLQKQALDHVRLSNVPVDVEDEDRRIGPYFVVSGRDEVVVRGRLIPGNVVTLPKNLEGR